ncbi:DEAD/DEAH box helicase family protein [Geomonas sp. RF6]|uniref:DEAD/DEAH box helicase family protein n=1 Tax=Geomonas sp. RF6 TaxID=2897342 RepID=UPI001E2C5FB6|nr:DEAD/DEAH box helicase family protein [Geomonas sp. RF6]UFS72055.1 DEAD/DEAH box helicase family protein [Geomonas sp. RF6]
MTDRPLIYNKLVRDFIPQIIEESGKCCSVSVLDDAGFAQALRVKVLEEAHELFHASSREEIINEAADLFELMEAILKRHGIGWEDVYSRRAAKRETAGGFEKRLMLHATAPTHEQAQSAATTPSLPQLLTFNSLIGLVDVIKRELAEAEALHIASAFYSRGMLNLLLDPFRDFLERGGRLRLLTSVMGNFNNPLDLQHLATQLPRIDIRIFYPLGEAGAADFNQEPPPFHIKSFLFEKPHGTHSIIVGSSNLTGSGLGGNGGRGNHEWNYFSNSETNLLFQNNLSAFDEALKEYEDYWQRSSVPIDQTFLDAYMPRWQKARELRRTVATEMRQTFPIPLAPRPAQVTALQALAERRGRGIRKTTVIAATGLGKTYLAAFDFQQSGMRTVLFIAHRENIVLQAMGTYRTVIGTSFFGEVLSGNSKPSGRGGSLFATVQTLSQPDTLARFTADAFDYIVVDEFHHADCDSYQRVLGKFRPKFLLGLTATPERMDGRDVLKICDYDVAFETRLFDAIENRWLVPFHYFAIHDKTDYSALHWTSRGYIESELDAVLINDTRAALVFNTLRKFLPATGKTKALAFCSSKSHATYMSRKFNELGHSCGMTSMCLLGENSMSEREDAMRRLQDERDPLQIICSVDIFGEGVDIPAVSHILFLRPTQSFTVFLQQLGRGLRQFPEKDYLVALDFVGNFRQSYVAPLAMRGYTSLEQYRSQRRKEEDFVPPAACYVSVETEVQRIWDAEIRKLVDRPDPIQRLKDLYLQLRSSLGRSPGIMDFFANPAAHDPYLFLKAKKPNLGENWLRVKESMEDLTEYEATLLGTPAEELLQHLETELSPVRSYKMVVLRSLLELGGHEWSVDDVAPLFLRYYLENRERLSDYDDLAKHETPPLYPLSKVAAHLMRMPLEKLENTGRKFFELDKKGKVFRIREDYRGWWSAPPFRDLIADRVDFALARYFYRLEGGPLPSADARGIAVKVGYAAKKDSGYTGMLRGIISGSKDENTWEFSFEGGGYPAKMDIEVHKGDYFVAWTPMRFDDVTRFPARIKAAATALCEEGLHGDFQVVAENDSLRIVRK